MTSRYDPENFEDSEGDIPEEATRALGDTPPRPKPTIRPAAQPPARPMGSYDRPAIPREPRQERQIAPMRQPPPAPPVMPPEYAPQIDYPPAPQRRKRQSAPPPPPPRSRKSQPPPPRRRKSESGWYLPWWSLIVLLVFVGGAAIGAWVVFDSVGGNALPGGQTPIVIVVTATFTVGPPPTSTPLPAVQATNPPPLPTIAATATLPPGEFRIGATVQVVGVGITGLNIRSGPGTDAAIRFVAVENSRWIIKGGPQNASGFEWWELQDPNNPTRSGWASRSFLTVVAP